MAKSKVIKTVIIVLIIYLLTVLGAGICHTIKYKKISNESVSFSLVKKEDKVQFGMESSEVYFKITNNGNNEIEYIEGEISLFRKADGKCLCSKNIAFEYFSESVLIANESEEFYLFLYDISHDRGGVENFDEIYSLDITELDLAFVPLKLNAPQNNTFIVDILGIIFQVPTYMLGALLVGGIFRFTHVAINQIENGFIRVLLIILLLPIWLVGGLFGGKGKKKENKGKTLTEVVEEIVEKQLETKK